MNDNTPEEVGIALCLLHEKIQRFEDDWENKLENATKLMNRWLHHPLQRNWDLVRSIEELLK